MDFITRLAELHLGIAPSSASMQNLAHHPKLEEFLLDPSDDQTLSLFISIDKVCPFKIVKKRVVITLFAFVNTLLKTEQASMRHV